MPRADDRGREATGRHGAAFPAASLDRPTRILTVAAVLLLLVMVPLLTLAGGVDDRIVGTVLGAVAAGLLLAAWGFGPASYELAGGTLRVRRRAFGSREFALTGRVRVAPATFGLGVRFGGTGGVFGWAGPFWQAELGRYHAYMTDRSRLVVCETDQGMVVISPAEPNAFVRAARRRRA